MNRGEVSCTLRQDTWNKSMVELCIMTIKLKLTLITTLDYVGAEKEGVKH